MKLPNCNQPKMVLALITLTLLPTLAVAAAIEAHSLVGQIPLPVSVDDVQKLAGDRSMASWFVSVAIMAITSWVFIFRWTLGQLDAQRKTNQELVERLLKGHEAENDNLRHTLEKAIDAIHTFSKTIGTR